MENITITKNHTASHEVDPQKGFTPFCPNELPVPDGHNIVNELNRQSTYAKLRTVSKDVHPNNAIWIANETTPQFTSLEIDDEKNIDIAWNPHCISGTIGSELIPGLPKITDYNFVVYKGVEPNLHPYSGVYHDLQKKLTTGLVEYYSHNNIDTIIIGGLALDYCVKDTAIDLANRGFRVIVNLGATRAINEDINKTILNMKMFGIVIIKSLDEIQSV
jgi:nicotinamidase/pyrazinamidase